MKWRPFVRADVPAAQRLSLEAGWPHRVEDWEFVLSLGSGWAVDDSLGLAACLLIWRHGSRHASLGMVLVARRLQRRGVGRMLGDLAVVELAGRNVLLNSTAEGERLYRQLGFRRYGTVAQHQGPDARLAPVAPPRGERLRPLGQRDAAQLRSLTARAAGYHRDEVMDSLLKVSEGVALDRDGSMLGFALVRRFGRGHVIGPVVAPDAQRAKVLIAHWIAHRPRSFLRVDVPARARLGPWLTSAGLPEVDRVASMALGEAPKARGRARVFALVNQALG